MSPRARRPRVEPVPGQTFGEAGAQEEALQQVEQATRAIPGVATPPVVPLDAPSEFPDEPVTAGLSIGAGPGPEALGPPRPAPGTQDLVALAPYLPGLELLADQPGASITTRNLVRRIRGALPPEARRQ